ncbi:MAG: flagellar biosynthetic protein FliR [Rhodobacteraceae bacterium]|nr:flagellar biosynthetic protein FliR [Paracoccaceae bacterium]
MSLTGADITLFLEDAFWGGLLVFLRIGAIVGLLPAFGEQSVPMRVRLALVVAFSAVVAPAVSPMIGPVPQNPGAIVGQCGAEVLAGLFFGLLLRLFVFALQTAGSIAAQSTSLSQIFGGSAGIDPQPAMGHVLTIGALALISILDLHIYAAAYMIESYNLVPPGTPPSPANVAEAGLAQIAHSFALAFSLAAPFVIAGLVYNITLGVINKAMPQLMVSFVGAPAATAGGLILLFAAVPLILPLWAKALFSFMASPFAALP